MAVGTTILDLENLINTLKDDGVLDADELIDVFNTIKNLIEQNDINSLDIGWASGISYDTKATAITSGNPYLSEHQERLWKSKSDGNINNEPPIDENIFENTYWLEVSSAAGSAIKELTPGIYGAGLIIGFFENQLIKLEVAERPFESLDISAEIIEGDWLIISSLKNNGDINVTDFGADPTGLIDSSSAIQQALDENVGEEVVIGRNLTDTFKIDLPIYPPAGSKIKVNGTMKLADGVLRPLTADLANGTNIIQVADADLYFKVGQKIVISDDNQPRNEGGEWKTRLVGKTNIVTAVSSTQVTCLHTFSDILGSGILTIAANATISQATSIFVLTNSHGTEIYGNGTLDGNKANQFNIAGAYPDKLGEDLNSSCGISIFETNDFTCLNIKIKDFTLHGIATNADSLPNVNKRHYYGLVEVDGCIDKSFAGLDIHDSDFVFCKNTNGVDEGEWTFYNACENNRVFGQISEGNRRYGFSATGVDNKNNSFINCHARNNGSADLHLQNQVYNTTLSDILLTGDAVVAGALSINSCKNILATNITIDGKINAATQLAISAGAPATDLSENIHFKNLTITNANPLTIVRAVTIANSDSVTFDGITIKDTGRVFSDVGGNSNIVFKNGKVSNFTTLFENDNGAFKFSNIRGDFKAENSATVTIPSGSTRFIVSHGLYKTPLATDIKVQSLGLGLASSISIERISEFTFDLVVDVDPGIDGAKILWKVETFLPPSEGEVFYTERYASDFSIGTDGWISNNVVVDGNIDDIDVENDVLRMYADATSGLHNIQRAVAEVGEINRVTFKYRIPAGQTNVDGIRVFGNVFALRPFSLGQVVDQWVEVTSDEWLASNSNINISMMKVFTPNFVGENLVTDDIIYIKDVLVESRPDI